ncbi:MAG: peptide chain release factor N(5)-glutamine methyltransferase [Flavobacteriales bacterium]|nr:peptide chain release factor N(5)-glutamine methyltransferase [Flavobacteriales bacterium]
MNQTKHSELAKYFNEELSELYSYNERDSIFAMCIEYVLKIDNVSLRLNPNRLVTVLERQELDVILERLKTSEPVQYVLGEAWFDNLILNVSPGVLIPRQETEELVALIDQNFRGKSVNILDIGTGSGAIALALKERNPDANVIAYDFSEVALDIAKENALKNNLDIKFELFDILKRQNENIESKFDVIVSNPPYVLNSEMENMHSNVVKYEPHAALFVEDDNSLIFYRAIFNFTEINLKESGSLYLEINEAKGEKLKSYLRTKNFFKEITIIKDLNGRDRFIQCTK